MARNRWQLLLSQGQKLFTSEHQSFWFWLSFVAPLYFGLVALCYQLVGPEYVVQDDVRQHVVWMQRFVDPTLFPNDAIADYYLAIAPPGYKGLYWSFAQLGIPPLLTAKLLPLALALITTVFTYKLSLKIFPVPFCGFLTTLILNQQIWLDDELITATPRAFYYPLLTAFLYFLVQRALVPCLIIIVLQGLFYAPSMLLSLAVLSVRLWPWEQMVRGFENVWVICLNPLRFWQRAKTNNPSTREGRAVNINPSSIQHQPQQSLLQRSRHRHRYLFWVAGCSVSGLIIIFLLSNQASLGPTVTADQMQVMREFSIQGRHEYFDVNPVYFWFQGRSGLNISWFPASILLGLLLPWLSKTRFRLPQKLTPNVAIIYQVAIASLGLYILAHLLLFKLYFPSRYTYHSLRIALALASGITLTTLLEAMWFWLRHKYKIHSFRFPDKLLVAIVTLLLFVELLVPAIPSIFLALEVWIEGQSPTLYTYLAQQPVNTLVATISTEGNNLGAFSKRSTLVSEEFSLAFHPRYHSIIKQRTIDLLRAQYSTDLSVVQKFISQYDINFFLVERNAFQPEYLPKQNWLVNGAAHDFVKELVEQLQEGHVPILAQYSETCMQLSAEKWLLLKATCISQMSATP